MANKEITGLDFSQIKKNLIDFIKKDPTFTDYDFEGSAVNTLMDILAYNTYYNGFYANMLHNESFVETAQKRSSLTSRAKELGYLPKSCVCSTALIDVRVNTSDNLSNSKLILKRGTEVKSRNENGFFTFLTIKDTPISVESSGNFFRNVELKQGTSVVNRFILDKSENPRAVFTIPNKNIDMSTLRVFVRESRGSLSVEEFFQADDIANLVGVDKVFFVQEGFDELFQIYFGDNIIGKELEDGNEVVVSYFVASGNGEADGCKTFTIEAIDVYNSISVTTLSDSVGGRGKESVDELRRQIVKSFASQNRAVTTDDYVHILRKRLPNIKNVRAWGGEDNIPPVYGKVYLCVQPEDGFRITDATKQNIIIPELEKFNVVTILPEIVDPSYTFVGLDIKIKFNRNRTVSTLATVEEKIKDAVENYFKTNLGTFESDFFESRISEVILATDPGIISISISSRNNFRFRPVVGIENIISVVENNIVVPGSIESTIFGYFHEGVIKKVIIKDDSTTSQVDLDILGKEFSFSDLYVYDILEKRRLDTIGRIKYKGDKLENSGHFELQFTVSELVENLSEIYVYYTTSDEDIYSARNQILTLDREIKNTQTNTKQGISLTIESYEK